MNFNFRAWDKSRNLMIDEIVLIDLYHEYIGYLYANEIVQAEVVIRLPINDVVLMQSIGLFDTNGEEIFEGDIVRLTFISNLSMVKEVKRIPSNGGTFPFCNYNPFEIGKTEIIGNIHENPELLNKDFVERRMREEEAK